ncbi:amylo-alpha-1,6-glucosidase [Limobrevibacterium gyesilva]|uniref:Trehalase family glycosidase n=1 Tax=Limobrevibacterium gyesilva TaxID=2991712 RepID=A0AA41YWC9_9PROT|nr:glycogen debranching N-terminal domain-containing protein [Limobrevibacterium gyesilva]MCW3477698.1 trehalase family glycosidase [Limobrevibacterium gyesilva]
MPLEITVGPPQLVVHYGQLVWSAEPDGQVLGDSKKGLIFRDTRLISYWRLYANGESWELLNGGAVTHFAARVFLTNRAIPTQEGQIPPRTLSLVLGRWASGGVHEDLDLTNHGMQPVRFNLELSIRSDFADLFEVKTGRIVRRGRITTEWSDMAQSLETCYTNADFRRGIIVSARSEGPAVYANGRISFDITLNPGASWHACLLYEIIDDGQGCAAPGGCIAEATTSPAAASLAAWRDGATRITTGNDELDRQFAQAVDDIAALRMPIDGMTVPAAGLPWFLAPFGRDSLIVSMQTLPVTPELARGALAVLGARQSRELDDARDAEPGKILHEQRLGELAHFKLIPHTPYFGSADATPLYLMLLHAAWRWIGDSMLSEAHLEVAERCLSWIDDYGDRDGDGFQEYQTRSPLGYENMGWKDALDAVLYPDGTMVKGPKALCELQGYVYAAWTGMAEIHAALGNPARAAELRGKATALYNRFNDAFWDEEWGFYAFALDGEKRKVLTAASNVGHCLWTGIVRPDRARRVMERLMAPDMFSGWGIRTLSSRHPAFNPYSYHNGSVWPHDNGLIAEGFKRYGFIEAAARVAHAISDSAAYFAMHQVPELYAGVARNGSDFPVQCLGANVPQAWAAGSAFSFLQAALGLAPDAPNNRLYVDPVLPDWLSEITVAGLDVGQQSFDIHFHREGAATRFTVLRGDPAAVVWRAFT